LDCASLFATCALASSSAMSSPQSLSVAAASEKLIVPWVFESVGWKVEGRSEGYFEDKGSHSWRSCCHCMMAQRQAGQFDPTEEIGRWRAAGPTRRWLRLWGLVAEKETKLGRRRERDASWKSPAKPLRWLLSRRTTNKGMGRRTFVNGSRRGGGGGGGLGSKPQWIAKGTAENERQRTLLWMSLLLPRVNR
jgi:hypothetical protein